MTIAASSGGMSIRTASNTSDLLCFIADVGQRVAQETSLICPRYLCQLWRPGCSQCGAEAGLFVSPIPKRVVRVNLKAQHLHLRIRESMRCQLAYDSTAIATAWRCLFTSRWLSSATLPPCRRLRAPKPTSLSDARALQTEHSPERCLASRAAIGSSVGGQFNSSTIHSMTSVGEEPSWRLLPARLVCWRSASPDGAEGVPRAAAAADGRCEPPRRGVPVQQLVSAPLFGFVDVCEPVVAAHQASRFE